MRVATIILLCLIVAAVSAYANDPLFEGLALIADIKAACLPEILVSNGLASLSKEEISLFDFRWRAELIADSLDARPWSLSETREMEFATLLFLFDVHAYGLLDSNESSIEDLKARYHRFIDSVASERCEIHATGEDEALGVHVIENSTLHLELSKVSNISAVPALLKTSTNFDFLCFYKLFDSTVVLIELPRSPCAWQRLAPLRQLRALDGVSDVGIASPVLLA